MSGVHNTEILSTLGTPDTGQRQTNKKTIQKTERAIKNEQSRELATLGTQDTGQRQTQQINVRENRSSNQEWTTQRNY